MHIFRSFFILRRLHLIKTNQVLNGVGVQCQAEKENNYLVQFVASATDVAKTVYKKNIGSGEV